VTTIQARLKASVVARMAPMTTARPELASAAHTRRSSLADWYGRAIPWVTSNGTRRGVVVGVRSAFGCALAVLRHPARASATIASPASQAIRTVTSVIDTQEETLLPAPGPPVGTVRRPAAWNRVWTLPLLGLAVLALVAIAVAALLPASLVATRTVNGKAVTAPYALTPRTATPVEDRVSFGGLKGVAEVDTSRNGDIYFVTVSEPSQSVLAWWAAGGESCNTPPTPPSLSKCDALPEIDLLTHDDKYGNQTPGERRVISLQQMLTASQVAQYVALQKLGYKDATIVPGAVVVNDLVCLVTAKDGSCTTQAPAAKVLQVGDTITSVDGAKIGTVEDLVTALKDKKPGQTVQVVIDRPGTGTKEVTVDLTASPDDPNRTIVGIEPFDTRTVHLPFQVDIDTGQIGGPSAGLAFTLTLIDELSKGSLTGGHNVAVTGTIDLDGSVGAIGGLVQKTSAVRQAGVDVFLVPKAQGEAEIARARQVAGPNLQIIPVGTLDEALAALQKLGGDPVQPHRG
jgi:Lon-like protease